MKEGDMVRINHEVDMGAYQQSDIGWSPDMLNFLGKEGRLGLMIPDHSTKGNAFRVQTALPGGDFFWFQHDLTLIHEEGGDVVDNS